MRIGVSVVIPTYNGRSMLEKHLPVVLACMREGDEVLVVDDASTDDTLEFLAQRYPQVRVLSHATNMRYAQSCNDGVAAAQHEMIFLLNNDVSPAPNVLGHLLRSFADPLMFAVGCSEQDSASVVSGRSAGAFRRGIMVHRRAQDQTGKSTLWAAGGSMMVRRSLWLEIGGMDVLFRPAYEEDRDLSYRALKMGYRIEHNSEAKVFHDHKTTNISAFGERGVRVSSYKNMFLFYWKNIDDVELVLSHLMWLPYHLIVGGIKTRGEMDEGFWQALHQFGEVWRARRLLSNRWRVCDHEIVEHL